MKQTNIFILLLFFSVQVFAQERNLSYYLEQGKQNSPLLKDYQNQLLAAKIDSQRLRAAYGTQVNGVSNNTYAPLIHGIGYDNAITNGGQVSALVTATKELNGRKWLGNQLQGIHIQNQGTANTAKISEQELKKNISAQYITAYGDWAQYSFNTEVLSLLKEEEMILKKLTQTGTYKQVDYLTFLVTMQRQELLAGQILAQYQLDFAQLNYLSGIADTSFSPIADPAPVMEHLPSLENTVFYQQFQIDSLQLKNTDAGINLAYRPKINLYTDGGFNSTLAVDPYKNWGISAGLSLVIPIYDGRQRKMQHDEVAISEDTRKNYQDFFSRQYHQQIRQLLQQLQSAQQLIERAGKQLTYAEGLMQANKQLLVKGDVRIADYVIAINNYLDAKNIITQNIINKYQLINQVNYWNSVN
ncbi:TolC family protein [Chitinophaga arvensicola]|uniref:Outer membrane protein TolC n=1 Tax=Chitinophaga arvensicola TaxID=29529 RepID=A0A1I0RIA8_9BACT|nr:TolC family protein [Chitinophaga arvensicola]SEW39989.1 Outer membrane protein TolC [Chitinophaga arvensicola]